MIPRRRSTLVLAALAVGALGGFASCSKTPVVIGDYPVQEDAGPPAPPFTPTADADGGSSNASLEGRVLACIGTECPAPYTTCPGSASILCGTNLNSDPEN